ncbi:hypothetical protein [Paenibacillus sp. MSJ-34]|uniref:hypothetical protein n=1 Tax=Paenibacillus sp. MSJ-34 TaxID=2841529 RepID=UPI001C108C60|nr:hypothetical protein [Paenibacillus sp. MSJ-34]MBU5445193.1 hypothetical protein [Paenibacillus sp. MSJ-34]
MSYTGKTDWKYDDLVTEQDLNRIEAGIVDHETRITDNEAHIANNESRIDAVETDLSDAPSAEVTLTHGMQVVTAPRKSPFRMQSLRGRTVIDETGMRHVVNPYIRRYGENLLPPFTEWEKPAQFTTILEPYRLEIRGEADKVMAGVYTVQVFPNTTYTLSIDHNGFISVTDPTGAILVDNTRNKTVSFDSGDRNKININVSNLREAGSFIFNRPMLNLGNKPLTFVPREETLLAFPDVTLCSSKNETLYDEIYEQDGRYYKRAHFKAMELDGELSWSHHVTRMDFKQLKFPVTDGISSNNLNAFLTKYDGSSIPFGDSNMVADRFQLILSQGHFYISIPNTDSGWGPDYKPTDDEIKAYFYGWRMYKSGQGNVDILYNGEPEGKAWHPIDARYINNGTPSATYYTKNIPTQTILSLSYSRHSHWQPYNLQYQLVTSTTEEVQSIGEITLHKGQNVIEVGCGLILREKANPKLGTSKEFYDINILDNPTTHLKNKALSLKQFYKNGLSFDIEQIGVIRKNTGDANGFERAAIKREYYDPTAVYTVDYVAFGPFANIPQIVGVYETALDNVVNHVVESGAQLAERVGVLEKTKSEKIDTATPWIRPTLLNGWKPYHINLWLEYRKNEQGYVEFRGAVGDGIINQPIFILPKGMRPWTYWNTLISTSNNSSPLEKAVGYLNIDHNGIVKLISGINIFVGLDNVTFLAEN